jgi:hypothetical protein
MKRYAGDDYTFIINRVKLEDRGEYIIRAENHYGYREEVVFLNVQRKLFSVNITFIMCMMWNVKKIKNYLFQ